MISIEKFKILTPSQKLPRMWEIWANKLLPKALKSCTKSNKSPNLVTLVKTDCLLLGDIKLASLQIVVKIVFAFWSARLALPKPGIEAS